CLEQRLGRGGKPHALPLQLGEGVVPRRHLREGLLGLAPCGATMGLLLLELGHAPPRLLQAGRRLRRRAGQRRRLLRPRAHLSRRCPFGLRAPGTLLGRVCELLPQLRPLPLQRRPLAFERSRTLRSSLQVLLELAHGRALCQEPVAPLLLEGGTTRQLLPDRREVALRGLALGRSRSALPLRLQGACFFLLPPLRRSGAPLAGIAQPLGGERQVTLQPSRLELRIGQATLHLSATRLGRVPRLDPGLALLLRLLQSGPLARQGCRQLLSPLPQSAQRQIEIFELAPHQRQRDTEALLDHLAVALRFAALPRQAPHLRLHLADQVFEPGEIRRRLFEAALGAGLAIAVQPDPGCLFKQGPPPRRALENDVFHFATAQQARRLLPQDPADGIGDVGLAAAVRTHDRRHARFERQLDRARERLEARQLEPGQSHGVVPPPILVT